METQMTSTTSLAIISPLRGLYGGRWYTVVACRDSTVGVAIPECVVFTTVSHTSRCVVYTLPEKPAPKDIDGVQEKVFGTPSFACGLKPIAPCAVRVWDDKQHCFVNTRRPTEEQVQGIAIADTLLSLKCAAERVVSYFVQEKEKKSVQCTNCGCVRRMCVDICGKSAAKNGVVTWTRSERKRFIAAQRALGHTGFSKWEEDNYLVASRSWFKDYIACVKRCPVCTGKPTQRPAMMIHVCMGCKRSMHACIANPCVWQCTKIRFWKEENNKTIIV